MHHVTGYSPAETGERPSDTVNSLLMDTSIRRTPGAGPGRFSVILL